MKKTFLIVVLAFASLYIVGCKSGESDSVQGAQGDTKTSDQASTELGKTKTKEGSGDGG